MLCLSFCEQLLSHRRRLTSTSARRFSANLISRRFLPTATNRHLQQSAGYTISGMPASLATGIAQYLSPARPEMKRCFDDAVDINYLYTSGFGHAAGGHAAPDRLVAVKRFMPVINYPPSRRAELASPFSTTSSRRASLDYRHPKCRYLMLTLRRRLRILDAAGQGMESIACFHARRRILAISPAYSPNARFRARGHIGRFCSRIATSCRRQPASRRQSPTRRRDIFDRRRHSRLCMGELSKSCRSAQTLRRANWLIDDAHRSSGWRCHRRQRQSFGRSSAKRYR